MKTVKGLLMVFMGVLLAACQAAATPAPAATPQPTAAPQAAPTTAQPAGSFDGWTAFTPDDGSFRILLPTKPKLQTQQLGTMPGKPTVYLYMTTAKDGAYGVMYTDYPVEAVKQASAKEILSAAMNGAAQKVGSEIGGSRDIQVAGYPGIDFTVRMPAQTDLPDGGVYASRVFLADNRLYQIIAVQAGQGDEAMVTSFFESFSLAK